MSEHVERALAEAYALGALDPPEKKLFEGHLGSCKICREAVGGAAVATAAIALTAPRETPPKGSGDRLVALYRQERAQLQPPPSTGFGGTLAILFLLAALGTGGWGYYEHERVNDLEKKVAHCHEEREVLEAPDMTMLPELKAQGGFQGTAQVAYSPSKGVVVFGAKLPEPPAGKCYKLWSVAGGKISPMGTWRSGNFLDRSPGGEKTLFAISEEEDPNVEKATKVVLLPG